MSKYNILSVDDSQSMREIIMKTLNTNTDYRVLQASNGEEAMRAIQENFIHLVVTDIHMPVMNGVMFIQEAKKKYPGLPILVLTTESEGPLKQEVMKYGANGWIVKPFKLLQLLSIVKEIFN